MQAKRPVKILSATYDSLVVYEKINKQTAEVQLSTYFQPEGAQNTVKNMRTKAICIRTLQCTCLTSKTIEL